MSPYTPVNGEEMAGPGLPKPLYRCVKCRAPFASLRRATDHEEKCGKPITKRATA